MIDIIIPTIDTGTGTWETWYPGSGTVEVIRTRAAFLLVNRKVLVDIGAADGTLFPWFREDHVWDNRADVPYAERNDLWISEDLFFCLQAQRCGYPIFVHTGVQIGHIKSIKLTEDLWRYHSTLVEMA